MALSQPFQPKPDTLYMEVPRCDRCTHWRSFLELANQGRDGGDFRMGDCLLFETRDGETPGRNGVSPLLFPSATGSGQAKLVTYGRFGCVQFEERKDA